jgi:hypothetical protein
VTIEVGNNLSLVLVGVLIVAGILGSHRPAKPTKRPDVTPDQAAELRAVNAELRKLLDELKAERERL